MSSENAFGEYNMPSGSEKSSLTFTAFIVLFTIFGIPIIIALPFLLWGFIGRM